MAEENQLSRNFAFVIVVGIRFLLRALVSQFSDEEGRTDGDHHEIWDTEMEMVIVEDRPMPFNHKRDLTLKKISSALVPISAPSSLA